MDNLFHFQANGLAKGKATASQQYFSEAESEDQETSSIMTVPVKKSTFGKTFNKQNSESNGNGYATDDASSDGEQQQQLKVTSRFMIKNKVSKFNNLSTQQPSGDQGLSEEDEHSLSPQKPIKEKKASSTFEGVKLKTFFETDRSNSLQQQQVSHESAETQISGAPQLSNQVMNSPVLPLSREHRSRVVHISPQKQFDSDAEVKKITAKNQALDNLKHHPFRHLIFSNFIQESSFKKHLSLTYRGLVYASKCLKGPSDKFLASKQVDVIRPKNSKGKTLLLDLDETLIHSCSLREGPDHIVTAHSDNGETNIGLKIRPFCIEFLQKLSELWDIFIFTASSPNYAEAIVNFLDPNKSFISGVLNRSNCMETKNGFFIKDLRIIRDSDLRSTILVDNLSHSFGFQPDNGVPIIEWHNDKSDVELKHLANYLMQAAVSPDVREFNRQYLKLQELILMKSEELGI